jgi:hypothetical protein
MRGSAFNEGIPSRRLMPGANRNVNASERKIMGTEFPNIALNAPPVPLPGRLTDADDTMNVRKEAHDLYAVEINGSTSYYTADQLRALNDKGFFNTKGGADNVNIDANVDIALNINTGAGPDTANLGGTMAHNVQTGGDGDSFFNVGRATVNGPRVTYSGSTAMGSPNAGSALFWNLLALMSGSAGTGFTQTSPGVFTGSANGFTMILSQPGGRGTPVSMTNSINTGALNGTTFMNMFDPKTGTSTTIITSTNLNSTQANSLSKLINEGAEMMLEFITGVGKKKKGGGMGSEGASQAAANSGDGGSLSNDGSLGDAGLDGSGSIGGSVQDIFDGEGPTSQSWFLALAIGMGTIMNKMGEKMLKLLDKIKDAGDDPPYKLTAEFQATAQMLSFMQQAFMAALNSLGESIKTGVTAGGAAR